jgi:aminoglycoside/choline kinase family phosphotransferase
MLTIQNKIKELFAGFSETAITGIHKLPQAGSERHYFRIYTADKTFIATYGANLKENDSFIYFSKHFKKKNLQVPQIICINGEKNIYLQEDFGDISLLNRLEENGFTTNVYDLYKKSLQQLALLQVNASPTAPLVNRPSWPICCILNIISWMLCGSLMINKS